jgi:cell division protein FtsB
MPTRRENFSLALLLRRNLDGLVRALGTGISTLILLLFISLALSGYFVWSAFSGKHGLFSYFEMRETLQKLEGENLDRLKKNHSQEKEIYLLRDSPSYVEKIAREEYGYIRKGEKIFWFPEGKEPSRGESTQGQETPPSEGP